MNSESNNWARMCDACRSAACTVYCRTDLAYLCTGCDSRIHAAAAEGVVLRHERVRVCEACERAPAALLCKADAASLCATCDVEIHSANPLAQRHHRVPIIPIPAGCLPGMGMGMGSTPNAIDSDFLTEDVNDSVTNEEDEDEAASWLLLNPVKGNHKPSNNGFEFGGGVVDEYLDLVDYNNYSNSDPQFSDDYTNQQQHHSTATQNSFISDSVVPVQSTEAKNDQLQLRQLNQSFHLSIDHETSKAGYNHHASIGHSVTISSMDVGIVPESTVSDGSISHLIAPKATIDLFSSPPFQMPTHQLASMDREARVLRYREKKKARRFEKTIRYASRKAYAETRPRIKGRFARRADVEVEVDQMFSTSLMPESGYGIVPSF